MALDEAILESTATRVNPPTLRLYSWEPPCLSLGYAQPFSDVDSSALLEHGWDLVRRPTGGRAILHTDELTYSVMGPQDDPLLTGGVLESYRRLSLALLASLLCLGLPAEARESYTAQGTGTISKPVCFEVPSNYEITVQGKKLIGSAQARRGLGVLQHGSLPLYGDLTRITLALSYPSPSDRLLATHRLESRATTVEAILGKAPAWEEAALAFEAGFQQSLGITLVLSEPTEIEMSRAEELVSHKYATDSWNRRI